MDIEQYITCYINRTIEELKLACIKEKRRYIGNINRTIEELKHDLLVMSQARYLYINRTIEELKRLTCVLTNEIINILIEPLRN